MNCIDMRKYMHYVYIYCTFAFALPCNSYCGAEAMKCHPIVRCRQPVLMGNQISGGPALVEVMVKDLSIANQWVGWNIGYP